MTSVKIKKALFLIAAFLFEQAVGMQRNEISLNTISPQTTQQVPTKELSRKPIPHHTFTDYVGTCRNLDMINKDILFDVPSKHNLNIHFDPSSNVEDIEYLFSILSYIEKVENKDRETSPYCAISSYFFPSIQNNKAVILPYNASWIIESHLKQKKQFDLTKFKKAIINLAQLDADIELIEALLLICKRNQDPQIFQETCKYLATNFKTYEYCIENFDKNYTWNFECFCKIFDHTLWQTLKMSDPNFFADDNDIDASFKKVYLTKCLFEAAEHQALHVVALLILELNADPISKNREGLTLLEFACKKKNIRLVQLLITLNGNINLPDKNGNTPLHYACIYDAGNVIVSLLATGANLFQQNNLGIMPLQFIPHLSSISDNLITAVCDAIASQPLEKKIQYTRKCLEICHNILNLCTSELAITKLPVFMLALHIIKIAEKHGYDSVFLDSSNSQQQ